MEPQVLMCDHDDWWVYWNMSWINVGASPNNDLWDSSNILNTTLFFTSNQWSFSRSSSRWSCLYLPVTAFVAAFTMEAAEQQATNKVHWRSYTSEKGITMWCRPRVRTRTIKYTLAVQKILNLTYLQLLLQGV